MDKTVQEHGRAELDRRADIFFKELLELASDATAQGVHKTRIESRRLRAALEAFREFFPARAFDSVYREVRRITRRLGALRESTVNIGLIRELAENRAAEPFCLEYLNKRFSSDLKKKRKQLLRRLGSIDPLQFRSRLESLISRTGAGEKNPANPAQKVLFRMHESAVEQAGRVLSGLTAPIREFPTARQFDQISDEEIHSMRIAAKKSRYTMEIYSSVWPGGLSEHIEKARKFQQAAGKYNDWSVLCRHLEDEVNRLHARDSASLAFEIGKLHSHVEMRKASLKVQMRSALIELQEGLSSLSFSERLRTDSRQGALSRASRKSGQKKPLSGKTSGRGAA